ncbi:hypothetical protein [Pseudobutyrivibrio xylanivorans]|uniref:Endolytic transglycosylase MltG n=1 Tax=Pseudobutyrivibrio xylanivorans TaxID=185007 RepID=A0A5P6VT88_PSEXY|nr:hypothetical protein [Pseudobutyrivibrio xylanivorans]QFJ55508.1 endolytic transglycosylase MltG [Pseudobutyrivibrio xylanivorans]
MRFKYYLRGIGIGITFATLILTISFYFGRDAITKQALTDEEIIEKATALGMTMPEGMEVPIEETEAESDSESSAEEVVEENTEGMDSDLKVEEEVINNSSAVSEGKPETKVEEKTEEDSEDETIRYIPFTVRGGESSEVVSNHLFKAGLVDSADGFNKYLSQVNIDNLIKTGTFYIKEGSSYDDIAALLVNKEVRTTSPPKGN